MRPRLIDLIENLGFRNGAWLVPTPELMYAIAIGTTICLFLSRCKAAGLPVELSIEAALAGSIGGIIGARLFFIIAAGDVTQLRPVQWIDFSAGTASWGVYIGSMVLFVLYLRGAGHNPLPYLDVAASCVGIGIFIARWSCFLNGDDFGRITSAPWAVRYPGGSYPYAAHLRAGVINPSEVLSLPTYPLQVLLAFNGLITFCLTTIYWRRLARRRGSTLMTFWLLYATSRFLWEFLRDPAAGGMSNSLSTSQWMCVSIVLTLAVVYAIHSVSIFHAIFRKES